MWAVATQTTPLLYAKAEISSVPNSGVPVKLFQLIPLLKDTLKPFPVPAQIVSPTTIKSVIELPAGLSSKFNFANGFFFVRLKLSGITC